MLVLGVLVQSCKNRTITGFQKYLNPEQLPSQIFVINPERDTTLVTLQGIILHIKKGDITSNEKGKVSILIKEALNIEDIVLAGLFTQNNGEALSSGGMMYLDGLPGSKISINQPIEVLLPTKKYNRKMLVYEGEENDGKINWVNPTSLPPSETSAKISLGEELFKANCGGCHKIFDDLTGPSLFNVTERRPKSWLYDFTRNPSSKMDYENSGSKSPDPYAECLFEQWKPLVMPSFSHFSDSALDAIYSFIKAESDAQPSVVGAVKENCCEKCASKSRRLFGDSTRNTQDDKVNLDISVAVPSLAQQNNQTYYNLQISSAGWYNIDMNLKELDACLPSELIVDVEPKDIRNTKVFLVIPDIKVFLEGTQLTGTKSFVFNKNNNLLLPHGTQCYILAFNESGDKLLYGKKGFVAGPVNKVYVPFTLTNAKSFLENIESLGLKDTVSPTNIYDSADSPKNIIDTLINPCGCADGF